MKIFLIGFMGSGKTTLGKKLARRMRYNFVDLDDFIESKEGRKIRDIFSKSGESVFRQKEADNLRLLEKVKNTIISVGGGAPCFHGNIDWMKSRGLTVYLYQSPDILFARLKDAKVKRPLLDNLSKKELYDFILTTIEKRKDYYEEAELVVDARDIKPRELEEKINEAIANRS